MTGTYSDLKMLLSNHAAPAEALGQQLRAGSLALNSETPITPAKEKGLILGSPVWALSICEDGSWRGDWFSS